VRHDGCGAHVGVSLSTGGITIIMSESASEWITASYSGPNGNCVEVKWVKSARSGAAGHCVEVAHDACCGDRFLVRDSKDPDGPVLQFTRPEWAAFVAGAKADEFRFDG
jgi:hypothetical protein